MAYTQNDKLDILLTMAAANLARENEQFFNSIESSGVAFDKRYYRRKNAIIRRERAKPFMQVMRKVASSVAIFIITVLAIGFVTIMSITALRNAVWEIIVTWYDEYIAVCFEDPGSDGSESTSSVLNEEVTEGATLPGTIGTVFMPSYIPEGYTAEVVTESKIRLVADYYDGEQWICTYSQTLLNQANHLVNNESTALKTLEINGCAATLFEIIETDEIQLVWNNGLYSFFIVADKNIDYDMLIHIAESVQEK